MSPEASDLKSIGVVLAANGEVVLRSDSILREVESGSLVYEGEELVTGPESNAEVRFADDTLLSQGADSIIALDDYAYSGGDESASALLFKMSQGTFRMVTGKIAEQNPDRFHIGTPLATIGIRGTTTVHEIIPGGAEKHGVEEIHSGKALLVQSIDGSVRIIDSPQALVDIAASGMMSTVRPMTVQEFETFREISPESIQQEQEIRDEQQDDQQTETEGNGEEQQGDGEQQAQNDGGAEGAEGGEQVVDGVEGGETGGPQITGEGVLEPGVMAMIADALDGETGIQEAVNLVALGLAEEAFEAVEEGDVETATQLLAKLENVPDDEDILELIEEITTGKEGSVIPEDAEDTTISSGDGTNWILGTSGNDTWTGTENTDYYKGLAGDDLINGRCGDDFLQGDEGNDTIEGGSGNDSIDGGSGVDFLSFATEVYTSGADVWLGGNSATVTGCMGGGVDTLANIEGVIGTSYGDTLSGSDSDNTLFGQAGNDLISGMAGSNVLHGGAGSDYIHSGFGADAFYYTALSEGGDTVDSFFIAEGDVFKFGGTDFDSCAGFGTVAGAYDGSNASLGSSDPAFVYDNSNNILWYDANGDSAGGNTLIATLVDSDDVTQAQIVFEGECLA